ncbi:DUF5805 domain-containing protein [Haloarcula sp. H-GB4]|uniref:DUF5805 domain-containing protein n=1 Tax=Haloarcula sp. H-GB4 TaxID=3069755 RepID=UPI0027B5A849|nr:DUF5805 domain-containing protein [Haloarcula sp. H-GB4]MDQ2072821.1 DUF5805 domain-containing protein [Haloarcula sp. H-GB4]
MKAVKRNIISTLEMNSPQGFEELVAGSHANEDVVEEALTELQRENRLAYHGRHDGYVTVEGDCAVCGQQVPNIECQRVTVSDGTDSDVASEEYVLHPHCRRVIFGSWE